MADPEIKKSNKRKLEVEQFLKEYLDPENDKGIRQYLVTYIPTLKSCFR